MSSQWNEFAYANEFVGNLRAKSVTVPVRVDTRVRVTTEEPSSEAQKQDRTNKLPVYSFGCGGDLPVQPDLQAMGRHYFKW
jgi:hypothetical protein